MGYLISEESMELVEAVRDFCENEVKEQSKEYDRTGEWPAEIYEKAKEMQLHMLEIPEEYGGLGLDKLTCAALYEEMARADAGFALTFAVSNIDLTPVMKFGTEEQKKRFCDIILGGQFGAFAITEPQAGSDAANGKTTARKDGDYYVLNGRKTFITNGGVAGVYLVTAMTDRSKGLKGMSAFIVEAGTPGLSTGHHEDKMGIRGSNTCDVVFDECRIPASALLGKEGEGFKIAMLTLDVSRTFVGCMAVGIAQRAMEEAIKYGKERHQFGRPVTENQAIQFKLADMQIKIEAARQLAAHALQKMDAGLEFHAEAAMAKAFAADTAIEVTGSAMEVFGGCGFMTHFPAEKLLRDARVFQIIEGTGEMQRMVVASHLLKEGWR